MSASVKYGAVAAVAVFFVGFTTGMGGALLPNIGFSVLMGVFAGFLYGQVQKYMGGERDE